jgi:hypothetical protein
MARCSPHYLRTACSFLVTEGGLNLTGLEKDYLQALGWYRKAAGAGDIADDKPNVLRCSLALLRLIQACSG